MTLTQRKFTISLMVLGDISRIKVALLISKVMKNISISQQNGTTHDRGACDARFYFGLG